MDKKTYLQWDHLISSNAELLFCAILFATACFATGFAALFSGSLCALFFWMHMDAYLKRKKMLRAMDAIPDVDADPAPSLPTTTDS